MKRSLGAEQNVMSTGAKISWQPWLQGLVGLEGSGGSLLYSDIPSRACLVRLGLKAQRNEQRQKALVNGTLI